MSNAAQCLQEHTITLEALRDEVVKARLQQPGSVVPGTTVRRPGAAAFATDAEEWSAVQQVRLVCPSSCCCYCF